MSESFIFPSVFNENYFQSLLSSINQNSSLKVANCSILPCNGKGEGFLSSLQRISIDFIINNQQKSVNIIAKSECTNDFALEKIGPNGHDVQNKEIKFFQQIAPKMMKIFEKFHENSKIIPNLLSIDDENKILFFEDLRDDNFTMADRVNGMDLNHMKISLAKLAKFHAASMIMQCEDKNVFNDFSVGMFNRNVTVFNKACELLYAVAIDEISTWKGCEIYAEKMRKNQEFFIESTTKCFDINLSDVNVLNHGDVWTTNLMFQYENDVVNDAVIIDFQFCHYGSAALDLCHFLFTSLCDELYNPNDINRLVQFYYYELKKSLEKYEYSMDNFPNLHDFIMEFYQKMFYGFVYSSSILQVMISDDPDNDFVTHHSDNEKSHEFRKRIMKSERFQKIMRRMLPFFDSMGILDEI